MAPAATATATATATAACLLLLLALASAATPAPAPAVDCTMALTSLSDCLDYVTPGSKTSHPPKTCCGEVRTAVSNPAIVDCLCAAVSSKQTQLPINMTRVLALPAACGAPASALSKCHVLPGGAPTEAPAPSPSGGASSNGGVTAPPPRAAATTVRSPVTAIFLMATVAAPLLAFYYL